MSVKCVAYNPKYKVGDKAYRIRIIMPKAFKTKIQKTDANSTRNI